MDRREGLLTTTLLRILPPAPAAYCWPWELRYTAGCGPWEGRRCCLCRREIAAHVALRGKHVACIYCGLDNGDLPAIDMPFGDYEP